MTPSNLAAAPQLRHRSFRGAFAGDLIGLELGSFDEGVREATRVWVGQRMDGATATARAGFGLIGGALAIAIWARTGRSYAALDDSRRQSLARKLLATRLPLVADYVRAMRALAVTYAFEQGTAPPT